VRPTGSRLREAIFNILGNDLAGCSVLDATGGSGILAFEAVSRGARPVLVVDRDPRVVARIRRAAKDLGLGEELRVRRADSLRAGGQQGSFQLVLADPPYAQDLAPWLAALLPQARETLVLEHDSDRPAPPAPEGWQLRTRRYGGSSLSIYEFSRASWDPAGDPSPESSGSLR